MEEITYDIAQEEITANSGFGVAKGVGQTKSELLRSNVVVLIGPLHDLTKAKQEPNEIPFLFTTKVKYNLVLHAFVASALLLKWYPQDFIGRAKLFDISAANQNQGDKCIFSPGISRLARKKVHFIENSLPFGRSY